MVNVNKLSEIVRYGHHADLLNFDLSRDIEILESEFTQPIDSNRIHNSRERYCLYIELIRFTQGPNEAIKRIEQDLADGLYYRIYMHAGQINVWIERGSVAPKTPLINSTCKPQKE